jgi:hypothetical protein
VEVDGAHPAKANLDSSDSQLPLRGCYVAVRGVVSLCSDLVPGHDQKLIGTRRDSYYSCQTQYATYSVASNNRHCFPRDRS